MDHDPTLYSRRDFGKLTLAGLEFEEAVVSKDLVAAAVLSGGKSPSKMAASAAPLLGPGTPGQVVSGDPRATDVPAVEAFHPPAVPRPYPASTLPPLTLMTSPWM